MLLSQIITPQSSSHPHPLHLNNKFGVDIIPPIIPPPFSSPLNNNSLVAIIQRRRLFDVIHVVDGILDGGNTITGANHVVLWYRCC